MSTGHESHGPRNKGICLFTSRVCGYDELTSYHRNEAVEQSLLVEVLDRLKRLEEHCGLENAQRTEDHDVDDSMSISSVESAPPLAESSGLATPAVIRGIISRIRDEGSRSMLQSNVFCHLRQLESCFFENEQCIRAINSAMSEIEFMQSTQSVKALSDPVVPKDLAKKFIHSNFLRSCVPINELTPVQIIMVATNSKASKFPSRRISSFPSLT